jgi:serine/threonine protein kinase
MLTARRSLRALLATRFLEIETLHTGVRFTVFRGRPRGSDRPVAIKAPNDASGSWLWDVLENEALALTEIGRHPDIVALDGLLRLSDDRPALVLGYCPGSLAETLHGGGRMALREALAVGVKLAGALEAVHAAGYVHCDVRPANVLLSAAGEPVLAGFDEAMRPEPGATSALHVTTAHTAPELLEGGMPTPATDVYALASTLYELIAGRAAFRAYAGESPASVVVRVLSGRVAPIVAPGIPLDVSDLLTWAMSGDPAARPPTPAWLAEELGRIERRQGLPRTRLLSA